MDLAAARAYLRRMSRLLRAMVLALVAAFAAGATVHAASLAAMTTTMAAMQAGDEAAGCDECVFDSESLGACDLICAPQLSGAVEDAAALPQVHGSLIRDAGDVLAAGRRAPPDPFPPRSAIPS
jgi:hypothetical protein